MTDPYFDRFAVLGVAWENRRSQWQVISMAVVLVSSFGDRSVANQG